MDSGRSKISITPQGIGYFIEIEDETSHQSIAVTQAEINVMADMLQKYKTEVTPFNMYIKNDEIKKFVKDRG